MFRKTILIPAMLLGTALFLTASTASAHPNEYHHGYEHHRPVYIHPAPVCVPVPVICHQYEVVFRPNCNAPWQINGFYQNQVIANNVAAQLQAQRFEAAVWIK